MTPRRSLQRGSPDGYDAFISYSHAHDREVARKLQQQLERFDRPFYRARSLRIFRDETNLAASSTLTADILRALGDSRWLIVMASPAAAASIWVRQEIGWWVERRGGDRMLIAWTDGTLAWDKEAGCFAAEPDSALPHHELTGAFVEQPRWVDLRWMRDVAATDDLDQRLLGAAAEFVAKLRDRPKDEIFGDHLRQQRRTVRVIAGAAVVFLVLMVAAIGAAAIAEQQRRGAQQQRQAAIARQLVAQAATIRDSNPDLARQLLVESYRLDTGGPAAGAVLGSTAIPRVLPMHSPTRDVAYSPSGDVLAVAHHDGVALVDPNTLKPLGPALTTDKFAASATFSADGHLLVVGSSRGLVETFDVTDAAAPRRLGQVPAGVNIYDLAFSSTAGIAVAIGGGAEPIVIDLHDPVRPRRIVGLERFDVVPLSKGVALSADGRLLAATGGDNMTRLWDLRDPAHPEPLPALAGSATAIAISPNGHLVAAGGEDDTTRVWDVSDPRRAALRATLSGQAFGIGSVAFSHDSKTLAVGAGDATIDLWSLADPFRPIRGDHLTGHTDGVVGLDFNADDSVLASAAADGGSTDGNGSVRLWRVTGSSRSSAVKVFPELGGFDVVPAFSRDGRTMAAGFPTALWDIGRPEQPARLGTIPTFNQGMHAIAFTDDGVLVSGLPLATWETSDPAHVRALTPDVTVTDGAAVLVAQPKGSLVVAGGASGALELWSVRRPDHPERIGEISGAATKPEGVAFNAEGTRLALVGNGGDVQLWDVSTASPKRVGEIRTGTPVLSAAAGPGWLVMTGDQLGNVTLWDTRDPRHPRQLATSGRHVGAVRGLAIAPSGAFAASASYDGTARLWQIGDDYRLIEAAVMSAGNLYGAAVLAFTPDGMVLAGVTEHGMQLWNMDLQGTLQRLCRDSAVITPAQWAEYLPGVAYDPPCA